MTRLRIRDSVPPAWRISTLVLYVFTAGLGLAAGIAYYGVVHASDYDCYQYNAMLMELGAPPGRPYTLRLAGDQRKWYRNPDCAVPFKFPMALSVASLVWTVLFVLSVTRPGTPRVHGRTMANDIPDDTVQQWQIVLWACLYNGWATFKSLLVAFVFREGYQKFRWSVLQLPLDDVFRQKFEKNLEPTYIVCTVLFFCISVVCTINFVATLYRCIAGIDFKVINDDIDIYDDDDVTVTDVEMAAAGPSIASQTNNTVSDYDRLCANVVNEERKSHFSFEIILTNQ